MANLPLKYVQQFVDRHLHPRFYFRRPGFKRVALPGMPGSSEFMAAYAEALAAGEPAPPVGLRQIRPGTINALAVSYFNSRDFRKLAPSTQSSYRGIIDRLCEEDGDKPVAGKHGLERWHIVTMMDRRSDQPESANGLLKMLRVLMKHAVDTNLRQDNPARDVPSIRSKSDGFHSWTEEEIERFEATHPIGSRARLAFALLLYTGQRRSDVVKMGRQHIRDGMLHVKQAKTGAELWIPVKHLRQIIDASPVNQLTFIVTEAGKPFTPLGFSNWFRKECDEAGLPQCSAHGLRKACGRRLAEAGCTQHEIAAITGHASLKEVVRYTKGADQRRLAITAMQKMGEQNVAGSVNPPVSNPTRLSTRQTKSK
jgi:site-specific recombinase XerD